MAIDPTPAEFVEPDVQAADGKLVVLDPPETVLVMGHDAKQRNADLEDKLKTARRILDGDDAYSLIPDGNGGKSKHINADTWIALAGNFNVTHRIVERKWEPDPTAPPDQPEQMFSVVVEVYYRGQFLSNGFGSCSTLERRGNNKWGKPMQPRPAHVQMAQAETRARSRALQNALGFLVALCGIKSTSAEEVRDARRAMGEDDQDDQPNRQPARRGNGGQQRNGGRQQNAGRESFDETRYDDINDVNRWAQQLIDRRRDGRLDQLKEAVTMRGLYTWNSSVQRFQKRETQQDANVREAAGNLRRDDTPENRAALREALEDDTEVVEGEVVEEQAAASEPVDAFDEVDDGAAPVELI